ncbi:VOC family protein [uncultured Tenacibaculum sp.]|uniref:VOC family protein n=1 Tax=uncultured Tenacibaculum sp. TaxID=174713 RepID=UPI0026054027|nr:VOC family protein [uncultured Tenacibaculum sp.]
MSIKTTISIVLLAMTFLSCSNNKNEKNNLNEIKLLQAEKDSLTAIITQNKTIMKNQMIRSLTFQDGNAENAMNFYLNIFDNSKIINVNRWGKDAPTDEEKIMQATFELDGNLFMCSDSPPIHDWNFTPAVANYIECESESELEMLFTKLSENGKVMMPLNNYGFSQKFGFIEDQFGVSWQLNLK